MNSKLHLSDVIDYEKDIKPFQFVEIHAGPGAGKNTFIEALAKGEFPGAPKMRVLLITSRRAKVDETFAAYEDTDISLFQERIGKAWDILDENGNYTLASIGNTVCTSAFIAAYMKNVFHENDRKTHLWDMYDVIAIDEVHSMMLDATYQDAPFHIYDLVNHFLHRCIDEKCENPICKHIILMTGTPEPLRNFVPVEEVRQNFLDKMNQCINIQPMNVGFVESINVINHLQNSIKNNKRCIYFGNRIDRIKELFYDEKLPKDKMVLSFSDEEKRKMLEEDDIDAYTNMVKVEEEIKSKYKLPSQFAVLFTTSRYKEGINIKDNIDEMIIETHNRSDAIQMAGRVRSGVKNLYIVVDASPYPVDYYREDIEQKIARIQIWGSTQADDPPIKDAEGHIDKRCYPLNHMLNDIPKDQVQKFIDLVEDKFPYIKYSYLYGSFMFYVPRVAGTKYIEKENQLWEIGVKNKSLPQIVQGWFPDANVSEYKSDKDQKSESSWNVWNKKEFNLNVVYEKKIVEDFRRDLTEIWGYKQLNKLLSMFSNYECVRAGSGKRGFKFRVK